MARPARPVAGHLPMFLPRTEPHVRITFGTSGTTGKTRGASIATSLAAVALALPVVGILGGTASAASTAAGGNQNATSTPYTNQGGVTTGSNTTKYEVVNGRSGSPAVGGGKSSGNVFMPQPYSKADKNNVGANTTSASNPYRSTRNGAPSLNGNGGGKQVGQPCAGCVGKADNKNPAGQAPNATDHNAGYECDRNHGIGRSNPAHTGCVSTAALQKDCLGVVNGTATPAMCTPPKDCLGVVNGMATPAMCTPPKDCLGVVNGTATPAMCTPPKDCLGVVNGTATPVMCTPPKECVGVCAFGVGNGGGAQGPGTGVPPGMTTPTGVAGEAAATTSGQAVVSAGAGGLPLPRRNARRRSRGAAPNHPAGGGGGGATPERAG